MRYAFSVIFACATAWSETALAENGDPCANTADIAEMVMSARQVGMSMVDVMAYFPEGDLGRVMVRDAYSRSRYYDDRVRQLSIEQFRDQWALACYDVEAEAEGIE